MSNLDKGYIQVYTGNGKGKTTAALGLCLRAVGHGLKVSIIQFMKNGDYGEIKALRFIEPRIDIRQYGSGLFIRKNPSYEDIEIARKGMQEIRNVILSGKKDLVILDEINVAISFTLVNVDEVIELIDSKPDHVELIFTGRRVPQEIIDIADLVTEMKDVKHYYNKGVQARNGIEK